MRARARSEHATRASGIAMASHRTDAKPISRPRRTAAPAGAPAKCPATRVRYASPGRADMPATRARSTATCRSGTGAKCATEPTRSIAGCAASSARPSPTQRRRAWVDRAGSTATRASRTVTAIARTAARSMWWATLPTAGVAGSRVTARRTRQGFARKRVGNRRARSSVTQAGRTAMATPRTDARRRLRAIPLIAVRAATPAMRCRPATTEAAVPASTTVVGTAWTPRPTAATAATAIRRAARARRAWRACVGPPRAPERRRLARGDARRSSPIPPTAAHAAWPAVLRRRASRVVARRTRTSARGHSRCRCRPAKPSSTSR